MTAIAIYGLHDETGKIRYVGRTNDLERRFVDQQLERNWAVGIIVLEWASLETYPELEVKWINHFGLENLDNRILGTTGGLYGRKLSEEAKRKIGDKNRIRMTGRAVPEHTKENIRRAMNNRVARLREEGKPYHTAEAIEKMRQAQLSNPTGVHRRK